MKLKNILKALKEQLPIKRAYHNFFITGNAWGMFSIRSHQRDDGKLKVMYNTKETAIKAATSMETKHAKKAALNPDLPPTIHFSVYKCIFCDGYHLGKNRENKI